jgi:acetylglutamate kinase
MENTTRDIHGGNRLALRYYDKLQWERKQHEEAKATAQRRLDQIRHLLVENNQLKKELDQTNYCLTQILEAKERERKKRLRDPW